MFVSHAQSLSHVQLFVTFWTVACQAPLSVGFFRQEHCSGLPFPPPWDLPNPGIKPASHVSPALQADSIPLSHRTMLYLHCVTWLQTAQRSPPVFHSRRQQHPMKSHGREKATSHPGLTVPSDPNNWPGLLSTSVTLPPAHRSPWQ